MSGKTTRKVTVEKGRRLSADGTNLSSSAEQGAKMKKRSVFERLGTAGAGYEVQDKCRTFMRDGDCPYGSKCKFSHDMSHDTKRANKGDKSDSKFDNYQDAEKSPEKKKDKRKFLDAERLKIEFKKDNLLKKKQTIAELYDEEVPVRKSKKEKKEKAEVVSSKIKKSFNDEIALEKEMHVRNVQLKGEDGKHKKNKSELKSADVKKYEEEADLVPSKKHKKKKYQDNSEEERSHKEKTESISSKKKKKKKEKMRHSSSSEDESEDDQSRKKKSKKDKYKSYESEDSEAETPRRKTKNYEHETIVDEVKKKKKKKRDKYDSENGEFTNKEDNYEKSERVYEEEKAKKTRKQTEASSHSSRNEQTEHEQLKKKKSKSSHAASPKKEVERAKEKSRRSASWSSFSESSLGEESDEDTERKVAKRSKQKSSKDDEKKERDRKKSKYEDAKSSHRRANEDNKDMLSSDRKRDQQGAPYARDHYSQQQQHFVPINPEPGYETWDRDRNADDRHQFEATAAYGRGRGHSTYRSRHDSHSKGGDDRPQYRPYQDQQFVSEQGRFKGRGGRESYGYTGNRRGGFQGDEDPPQRGRPREFFQGSSGHQQGYPEDKMGHQNRKDHSIGKPDVEGSVEREQKRGPPRSAKELKARDSRSPKPKKREENEQGIEDERSKTKKRKREAESTEKDVSLERKGKRSKVDAKSDSDSGSEVEKSDRGKRGGDQQGKRPSPRDNPRDNPRAHRETESHHSREELADERKEKRSERGSRERDRRYKRGNSSERSRRDKNTSRSGKRGESHSHDEGQGNKVEDKRVKALKASHGRSSSDRSDNDTKTQKRSSDRRGRNTAHDATDINLDDVYETISDEELDFFDEENSKAQKPASLEDMDWSALAAIAPASKRGEPEEGECHRNKHTAVNVLRSIGFSSNLLSQQALAKIKKKFAEGQKQENEDEFDISEFAGTGALVLSKIRNRSDRLNLIKNMTKEGTALNMRRDINIRKQLRLPPNKLWTQCNMFCNAPSAAADKELFMASAALYDKVSPGETESSFKIIPSLVGSVIQCCT